MDILVAASVIMLACCALYAGMMARRQAHLFDELTDAVFLLIEKAVKDDVRAEAQERRTQIDRRYALDGQALEQARRTAAHFPASPDVVPPGSDADLPGGSAEAE